MEEAAIKREAEHNEDKMKLQRTESLLMRAARGVVQAKDAITHTQHQMILEGLQAEKIIEVAGIHYYLYRRPCVVSQTFKPTGDEVVSRDHMYIYRVETSAGYHWDAVPLQNGDIGTVKHKAIPKDVKKYLFEQYRESALFVSASAGYCRSLAAISIMAWLTAASFDLPIDFTARSRASAASALSQTIALTSPASRRFS